MNLHRINHSRFPGFTAACLTALAAFVSGCGGGGGSTTGNPAPTNTTAEVSIYSKVAPAQAAPVATGALAADAIAWMNYRRAQIGLAPMATNDLLDRAAQAHASYIKTNNSYDSEGHNETTGKPGFTGVTHSQRIAATAYPSPFVSENMAASIYNSGADKTDLLIDAPYHRQSQFAGFADAGAGSSLLPSTGPGSFDAYYYVINFGGKATTWGPAVNQVLAYPPPGQQNTPVGWRALERPNPVPDLTGQMVGYPISLQSAFGTALVVSSFTLSDSRAVPVNGRLITTRTDTQAALGNFAFWIPLAPLLPDAAYTAKASGSLDGLPMNLSWSFKTAAAIPPTITASAATLAATVGSKVTVALTGNQGARLIGGASSYSYFGNVDPGGKFASIALDSPSSATVTRSNVSCNPNVYTLCSYRLFAQDDSGAQTTLDLTVN